MVYPTIEFGRRWPLDSKNLSKALEGYYPSVKWNSSYPSSRHFIKGRRIHFLSCSHSTNRLQHNFRFNSKLKSNQVDYSRFVSNCVNNTSNDIHDIHLYIKIVANFRWKNFPTKKRKKISSAILKNAKQRTRRTIVPFFSLFFIKGSSTREIESLWIPAREGRKEEGYSRFLFRDSFQGRVCAKARVRATPRHGGRLVNRDRIELLLSRPNLSRRPSSTEWRAILSSRSTKIQAYPPTNLVQIKSFLRYFPTLHREGESLLEKDTIKWRGREREREK